MTKAQQVFEKLAESNVLSDFAAGVEPTGVFTFRHASGNKKHHGVHKLVGDIGGFLGGATISTVLTAAGTGAIGKALTKKYPTLGKALITGAHDALETLNPKSVYKTLKNLPESSRISLGTSKLVNNIAKAKNITLSHYGKADSYLEASKKYIAKNKTLPGSDFTKGVAMLGALATGTLGGALNATSAHTQYNTALNLKKAKKHK